MIENPYFSYAQSFEKIITGGKDLPFGGLPPIEKTLVQEDAPVVLIMSPHPDDECILEAFLFA